MSEQTKTEQPMTDAKLAEIREATEVERLREALKWAVSFIQCNHPQKCGDYPDYRNAVDLVHGVSLSGPFERAMAAYEVEAEKVKELAAELERVRGERDDYRKAAEAEAHAGDEARKEAAMWRQCVPDRCPITGLPFFMPIGKEDGTWYATYGGPYDSYTIPQFSDDEKHLPLHEREMYRERYDHDEGGWLEDECEVVGQRLIEDEVIGDFEDKISTAETALSTSQSRAERAEGELAKMREEFAELTRNAKALQTCHWQTPLEESAVKRIVELAEALQK